MFPLLVSAVAILAPLGTSEIRAADSADEIRPLLIGAEVPDVEITTLEGEPTALRELLSEPTVLIFYRGGWCPYCNEHLAELVDVEPRLRELGFQVIALSPDLPEHGRASVEDASLGYRVLSDSRMEAARAFGIAFRVEDSLFTRYRNDYGIDLERSSGQTHHELPVPSVFVIDEGRVAFHYVHPDYRVRVPAKLLLAAAEVVAER